MQKKFLSLIILSFFNIVYAISSNIEFSTAGFYEMPGCGREVINFNTGWRFSKDLNSSLNGVELPDYDDSEWEKVSIPHGLELLPEESGGERNYQGKAWYRKRFNIGSEYKNKEIYIHFEAIMGKSKIWLNGKLINEHFGGYLPVIAKISDNLLFDKSNSLVVLADNSDDPSYPPGKSQHVMDFSYLGGIYRDCMLIVHNDVYITDPNYENIVAGGGTAVWSSNVNKKQATVNVRVNLKNDGKKTISGKLHIALTDSKGLIKAQTQCNFKLNKNRDVCLSKSMDIKNPSLWSPESPELYFITYKVLDNKGNVIDGYKQKIGIRTVEFKGKEGFWLNGEQYPYKLMGVNRHQEFATIGNAMPNSLNYRDAQLLKSAGVRIIRAAHYPHDPSFMDACDQLGIFVIVATPGWQFWNNDPIFEERVISDIRNMVRRDRNRPCVLMWEPILNETHFPESFSIKALRAVESEWPYTPAYSACDSNSKGSKYYPVIYSAPDVNNGMNRTSDDNKVYFTREWGDFVDDWDSHNSPSRAHRSWGENPMLIQASHYANPPYQFTCYESFYNTTNQQIGGTIWCGFDHSRGYHPQNFYGGLLDSYRQPKFSYYMVMSQRPVTEYTSVDASSGPMIYIANELTPFSSCDVTVFSNCEEVRLTVFDGGKTYSYSRSSNPLKMPSPIVVFKDAFKFSELQRLARKKQRDKIYVLAEGLIDGKVVVSQKKYAALKPTKLRLRLDDNAELKADGSDVVLVVAELTDNQGNVKRLNNDYVRFSIEGEGRLLEAEANGLHRLNWGTAPILVQSTTKPGKIKIRVQLEHTGISTAMPVELEFESKPSNSKFIADKDELITSSYSYKQTKNNIFISDSVKEKLDEELKNVHNQQEEFGEKEKQHK